MNVRALTGMGSGKTNSSASGQSMANATPTPSTAPEAPTIGALAEAMMPESRRRQHRGADAAVEIVEDERPAAEPVLDRRAEHEQHEHVAQQVQQPRVDEHVGDEGPGPVERLAGREPERLLQRRRGEDRHEQEQHHRVRDDEAPHPGGQSVGGRQIHRTTPSTLRPRDS